MSALCAQTYRPLEIIAVDDGSTDGGGEVLQAWNDPFGERPESEGISVRVILQKPLGLSAGRNNALNAAKGEWVAITDIDCRPEADWIERMVAETRSEASYHVVGITGRTSFQAGETLASKTRKKIIDAKYSGRHRFTSLANGPCSMFDRRSLLSIGGFGPEWYHAEDMEVSCRLTEAGGYIIHTPDAVVQHVAESDSRRFLAKRRRDSRAHVRIIRTFGRKGPRRPNGELVPFDFTSDARKVAPLLPSFLLCLMSLGWGVYEFSSEYLNPYAISLIVFGLSGAIFLLRSAESIHAIRWSLALWVGFLEGWLDALLASNGHHRLFTKRRP